MDEKVEGPPDEDVRHDGADDGHDQHHPGVDPAEDHQLVHGVEDDGHDEDPADVLEPLLEEPVPLAPDP